MRKKICHFFLVQMHPIYPLWGRSAYIFSMHSNPCVLSQFYWMTIHTSLVFYDFANQKGGWNNIYCINMINCRPIQRYWPISLSFPHLYIHYLQREQYKLRNFLFLFSHWNIFKMNKIGICTPNEQCTYTFIKIDSW
jgi:hypothetical protein